MDVRIGTTLDGQPIGFDTSRTRALWILGDADHGKTTIARYLTRWWLADTTRHAHVITPTDNEWRDLPHYDLFHPDGGSAGMTPRQIAGHTVGPTARTCTPSTCLVIVDDLDRLESVRPVDEIWPSTSHLVLTSRTLVELGTTHLRAGELSSEQLAADQLAADQLAAERPAADQLAAEVTCLGLVLPDRGSPTDSALLDGQGRLDWPTGTIPVIPNPRTALDSPCHRWHTTQPATLRGANTRGLAVAR